MFKPALNSGIIFAALAVILGAMGAHALKPILSPESMISYETAVKYQIYHSLALLATGLLYAHHPHHFFKKATWLFISGILLFSGSIYLLVYLKTTQEIGLGGLGMLTPIGGVLFIIAWIFLALGVNGKYVSNP